MTRNDRSGRRCGTLAASFAGLFAATMFLGGCADPAHSGALIGAGVGAVAGQAAGQNTQSTVGGAAVGAGIGYAVGSQYERARRRYDGHEY